MGRDITRGARRVRRPFFVVHTALDPITLWGGGGLAALILFLFGWRKEAQLFALAFIVTFGIVGALKYILRTPRPAQGRMAVGGYAFPSGHAAAGAFFAVMFAQYAFRVLETDTAFFVSGVLAAGALLVAASRVFLHAHTTFQVAAGVLIGLLVPLAIVLNQTTILRMLGW